MAAADAASLEQHRTSNVQRLYQLLQLLICEFVEVLCARERNRKRKCEGFSLPAPLVGGV